jgi:Fe-S-cluster containining protein
MNRHERRAEDVQHKAALARANARLKTQMSDVYNKLDHVIDEVVAKVSQKTTISCSKGCAYCCDQVVTSTLLEAEYIAARYPALVKQAVPELRRQEARMLELGMSDMSIGFGADNDVKRQQFLARWYLQREPCVFLDPQTKECRIYAARPYGCRAHFAITQPAIVCDARANPDDPNDNTPQMTAIDTLSIVESAPSVLMSDLYMERHGKGRLIMGPLQVLLLYLMEGSK